MKCFLFFSLPKKSEVTLSASPSLIVYWDPPKRERKAQGVRIFPVSLKNSFLSCDGNLTLICIGDSPCENGFRFSILLKILLIILFFFENDFLDFLEFSQRKAQSRIFHEISNDSFTSSSSKFKVI